MLYDWSYDRSAIVDVCKMRKFSYEYSDNPHGYIVIGWFSDTETVILRRFETEEMALDYITSLKDQLK